MTPTTNPTTNPPEREKHYETDVRTDRDYDELPKKARFVITEAYALEILRLSGLVIENDLYKVERFSGNASWLEGVDPDSLTEVSTELDSLNVSRDQFWFACCLKHTDVEVWSEPQPIAGIKEWLGVRDAAKPTVAPTVATPPRVLVVVSGGIADPVSDAGVDVQVFDWDNYKDDPEGTGGVPDHFADLAEPIGVPVGEEPVSSNRPTPRG